MTYDSRPATREHIQQVRDNLDKVIDNLRWRSVAHDASKLESPEVEFFDEFTPKLAGSTYGSEEYREFLAAMKPGLDHHYAASRHHPEHFRWRCRVCDGRFTDWQRMEGLLRPGGGDLRFCPDCCVHGTGDAFILEEDTSRGLHGMTLLDVVEMFCDWQAAVSRHKDGNLMNSIAINQKRFGYSDEVRRILENTVREMGLVSVTPPAPSSS